jgi:glutathione peroxidase
VRRVAAGRFLSTLRVDPAPRLVPSRRRPEQETPAMNILLFFALLMTAGLLDLVVLPRATLAEPHPEATAAAQAPTGSFYDLPARGLLDAQASLAAYRGKVALVVNVASKCGLTPQYAGLEQLYREMAPKGFVILGFPSNDFLGQEPGTPEEIQAFCDAKYGVTFPLFEKVRVKGDEKSPVYRFLTRDLEEPSWNFTKYLVDRQGRVIQRFDPRTPPDDPKLREAIAAALAG